MTLRSSATLAAALLGLGLAGCGSTHTRNAADTTGAAASGVVAGGSGAAAMPGMGGAVPNPIPTRTVAQADWKSMRITAQEMTPVPFYVDNGTGFTEVKPTKHTAFHLMVRLTDRHTGQAIPYATVWASISQHGRTVFNERQWPMLSEYTGPHYGNDITLPGPGTYKLSLLVSAPVAALHVEYAHMWLGTHTVTSTFTWK